MNKRVALKESRTLMLDMDGTLLDLAFDNYMWLTHIPAAYARARSLPEELARAELYEQFGRLRGQLEWYCLDHWSDRLQLDIVGLHHAERARIGWLPGAQEFLQGVQDAGLRVLLVTNSHRDTLDLKSAATGIATYFDEIYTAHDFGFPKERREFWEILASRESFDPSSTMFVDDTEPVLASARAFGVNHVVKISRPDTTRDARPSENFPHVASVMELLE
ncbi:MAG: HAD-IA family hydrolase [Woeseia sp.]|nr:HAD-IA family hydrolase [Woeseia sp.]MBT8097893.1 HAD-IA family hydrolase [Woeseia sp.]NNE59912.1 HAD-IA family hydrolase [Woeseia sp.]NNL54275.1 HAD-IA family hydrolase [Woeseia sp.]